VGYRLLALGLSVLTAWGPLGIQPAWADSVTIEIYDPATGNVVPKEALVQGHDYLLRASARDGGSGRTLDCQPAFTTKNGLTGNQAEQPVPQADGSALVHI